MKSIRLFSILLIAQTLLVLIPLNSSGSNSNAGDQPIIGRWDITVQMGDQTVPSWLEVKLSGIKTLVGYFVAEAGRNCLISHLNCDIPTANDWLISGI